MQGDGWKSRKFWLAVLFVVLAFAFVSYLTFASYAAEEKPPFSGAAIAIAAIGAGAYGYQHNNVKEKELLAASVGQR